MVRHVAAGTSGSRRYRLREAVAGAVPEALCARGATAVAVSDATAEELWRHYRQRAHAVIPNGVDTTLFSPGDRAAARARLNLKGDARYALFVGRCEHRKGSDLVVEACRRGGFELVVAGSGAPPEATALGVLGPAELAHAYRAADCVILPSRYEACSFVVLEALASGVPLITTEVGWVRHLVARIPDYRRWIVEPELGSLAGALQRFDDQPDLVARARDLVGRENSIDAFANRWRALIGEVCGG
jgi:glycosyltransferase involved in cell wall biosynthesis